MVRGQRDERIVKTYRIPAVAGYIGATAGFTVTSSNTGLALCPASQTNATWIIPIINLEEGDIIKSFYVSGQAESAANAYTVDCDLRATTAAIADHTDASIQAMTQVSESADYLIDETTALATPHKVIAGENYYAVVKVTTAANTDVALGYLSITVERHTD